MKPQYQINDDAKWYGVSLTQVGVHSVLRTASNNLTGKISGGNLFNAQKKLFDAVQNKGAFNTFLGGLGHNLPAYFVSTFPALYAHKKLIERDPEASVAKQSAIAAAFESTIEVNLNFYRNRKTLMPQFDGKTFARATLASGVPAFMRNYVGWFAAFMYSNEEDKLPQKTLATVLLLAAIADPCDMIANQAMKKAARNQQDKVLNAVAKSLVESAKKCLIDDMKILLEKSSLTAPLTVIVGSTYAMMFSKEGEEAIGRVIDQTANFIAENSKSFKDFALQTQLLHEDSTKKKATPVLSMPNATALREKSNQAKR